MSVTANAVLQVARSQIGFVESGGPSGHDGNVTKYWAQTEPRLQGASWCADFVSWVFRQARAPLPAIDRPYGYVACGDAVAYARRHGLWTSSGRYQPGWIIFYCFDGSGYADHTGIVVSDDGINVHTIEGNTEPGLTGSQANGGGVYAKIRPHGSMVLGCMRTDRLLASSFTRPKAAVTAIAHKQRVAAKQIIAAFRGRGRPVKAVGGERHQLRVLSNQISRVLHLKKKK